MPKKKDDLKAKWMEEEERRLAQWREEEARRRAELDALLDRMMEEHERRLADWLSEMEEKARRVSEEVLVGGAEELAQDLTTGLRRGILRPRPRRRKMLSVSEAARLLAQRPKRKRYTKRCEWCGAEFQAAYPYAKWCSNRCAQRACRARKAAGRPSKML